MSHSMRQHLDDVPLRNVKAALPAGETLRQKVTPDGALVELAMNHAVLEPKQLADAMGVSTSFLLRGFKDTEHISWQRLQRAGAQFPTFKRALLEVQAADTEGVAVRTVIELVRRIA